jgi:hypothetical protein
LRHGTQKLEDWGACVIDDGTLVDSHTGKKLHGNHVRCLLRREYQRQGRELRGRSLDVMLDAAIKAIVRVNRQVIEQRRGKVSETVLDVVDSFL